MVELAISTWKKYTKCSLASGFATSVKWCLSRWVSSLVEGWNEQKS